MVGYFAWPYAFTVVPIAQVEQQKISEAFDPVKYVDGIWDSKILPTINEKAVNLDRYPDCHEARCPGACCQG